MGEARSWRYLFFKFGIIIRLVTRFKVLAYISIGSFYLAGSYRRTKRLMFAGWEYSLYRRNGI